MQQHKQYIAPSTDVFNLGPNARLMEGDFGLNTSNSMASPGAPMRHPLDM